MKFAETHSAVAPSRPSSIAIPDSKAILTAFAIVVLLLAVRFAMGLQLDGMDDAGYLEAARRVSRGESLDSLFPLFRTRVGMAYPLGWLVGADWISPSQFWLLTTMAECVTVVSLLVAGRLLGGATAVGVWAALLYAVYPLAVQQGMMYYPTAFQVASITAALALIGAAEGLRGSNRIALAFAAGVSLGLGYLVKEDVAIVVPALVLAAAVVRYPRISTTFTLCAGAALVFALESLVYWQSTGNPLFRLNATSGLGFASQDNLQNRRHLPLGRLPAFALADAVSGRDHVVAADTSSLDHVASPCARQRVERNGVCCPPVSHCGRISRIRERVVSDL